MNPDNTPSPNPYNPQNPAGSGYQPPQPGQQPYGPPPSQPPMPMPSWQPQQPNQVPSPQYQAPAPVQDMPELPQPQTPQSPLQRYDDGRGRKRALVALVSLLVLGLLGAATYFLFFTEDNKTDQTDTISPAGQSEKPAGNELKNLEGLTVLPPSDLSRYEASPENTSTAMDYLTTEGGCSLQLGIQDEAALPGKDIAEIVSSQIRALSDQGITVDGPSKGPDLKVKDASDDKQTYSLPTLVFTAEGNGRYIRSHYSAVILKDKQRLYIARMCESTTGPVAEDALKSLDEDAAKITIVKAS